MVTAAAVLLLLSGGSASVQLIDLIADDPDESEPAFAILDTLSIRFSEATTAPGDPAGLDRQAVDELLVFSSPIEGDYWAHWNPNATELTVTIGVVNALSAPVPGSFSASCRSTGALVAGAGASACTGSATLRGAWGYTTPSSITITELRAADADDADEAFGARTYSQAEARSLFLPLRP